MRYLTLLLTLLFFCVNHAKAQIDAGTDVIICDIEDVDLSADYTPNSIGTSDYTIENIPIDMDPFNSGTNLNGLGDDIYSGVIDIGFDFCFYGNIFNQLLISTNNYVTFDLTNASAYSPWNTYAIPSAAPPGQVINAIMGPWMDLNPNNGGGLYYNVYGVAPFRRFVASFENFGYFSCAGLQFNGQIKIFETTNVIEIHIQDQPLCANWNNGESVLGIVNEDESQFLIEAGWNNTQLTGNNQAFRFVPDGANNSNVIWQDDMGNVVGNGTDITVSPLVTTTYTVTASECPDTYTDDVTVFVSTPVTIDAVIDDNICPGEIFGAIDITTSNGTAPFSFDWTSINNNYTSTSEDISNLVSDTYNLTVTDNLGCEHTAGPFTISPPPQDIEIFESIDPVSCFGFSDGVISTTISGGTTPYTYNWIGDNPMTGNGTTMISDLASGNYQITVTDNNNCQNSADYFLPENSSISLSSSISDYNGFNVRCYGGNDAWVACIANGGLLPYTYHWVDLSTNDTISKQADAYNLVAGSYTFTVEDAEGCPNSITFDITQPDSLSLDIANYSHKSCTYNNDGFIEVSSWGGPDNPPYSEQFLPISFVWKGENSFYSTEQNIYDLSEGSYTITVEDANQCINDLTFEITQPPFVIADYRVLDDTVTTNYPIVNLYDNSEGNIVEWQWELSNGFIANSQDVMNLDLSTNLDSSGIKYYDLKLVVTDEFMCKDSIYGTLAIKEEHTLFVPNGFTPDLDGNNDTFKIFHHAMKTETFSISIFDRYGSLVFQSNDPDMAWDGTNVRTGSPLITGTYSYVLSYQDFEYRIYDHTNCENCTGTITLVR